MARRVTRGTGRLRRGVVLGLWSFSAVWAAQTAQAQLSPIENPVYLDDSTAARVTLERLDELIARGSEGEAVRAVQQLLDEEGERLLPSEADGDLFVTVRERVHAALLARPELLERYREAEEASAAAQLETGEHAEVERSRLLTLSGLEAALRVAQQHLEGARFDAARRTLEQLEDHPDFEGAVVSEAAGLAALVSRYAGDAPSRRLAARWAARAGQPWEAGDPIEEPAQGRVRVVGAMGAGGWTGEATRVGSVLTDPVESVQLTPGDESDGVGRGGIPSAAWTLPTIAGDTLYLNDGETISAWDRFTMRPQWRVRTVDDPDVPMSDDVLRSRRDSLGRNLEDPTGVTVHGDLVLAVSGRANAGERRGDPRVHAFDRATGTRIWSVNTESLDSTLSGGSIRGPVQVSDGVAVVAVRKMLRRRRLVSILLVGLELGTGELRWVRQVASTGSLPFQQYSPLPVGLAEADGVVYLTDVLGVAAAVEAATGRSVWVTRQASNPFLNNTRTVWMASNPVIDDDSMIAISADGLWVTRRDVATGEEISRRPAADFGEPGYLVRAGDWLCAVGRSSVSVVSLEGMEVDDIRRSIEVRDPGIRGRAVPAGDTLAVPVSDGMLLLDPASERGGAAMSRELVTLSRSGNALVLDGQAVVVDDSMAHNFLSWEVASALLEARLDADPSDPGPALIYTELAFRSGEVGRLVEITDRAIEAVEGLSGPRRDEAGDRLFEALSLMVTAGGGLGGGRERGETGWGGSLAGGSVVPGAQAVIEDASVVRDLLDRMGRLARTPSQRVITVLAQAELAALEGDSVAALERYQRVLSDPELRGAEWRGGPLVVRAGVESLRRLERLLERDGLVVYGVFEGAAEAEAASVVAGDLAGIRGVASRYPAAGVSISMWLTAGRLELDEGRFNEGLRDLREGLGVIERRRRAGGETSADGVEGELAGLLISALVERDRVGAGGRMLERVRRLGITPTLEGRPATFAGLGEGGGLASPARIGRSLAEGGALLLPGEPLVPVVKTRRADPSRVLLLSPVTGELILADEREGELGERWRKPIGRATPLVIRSDLDTIVVLRPRVSPGSGGWLESLDAKTGETQWRSLSFDDAARGRGVPRGARVELGDGDAVSATQLLVAVEDTTAVLLERWGRAVAIDLSRGVVLWAEEIGVRSVTDAAIVDGVLVVGGESDAGDGLGAMPSLVSVEARTGDVLQRIDGLSSEVRWIRAAGVSDGASAASEGLGAGGGVVVGLRSGIIGLDVETGQPRWNMTDEAVRSSRDAWVAGSGVTVLTEQGGAWLVELATGRLRPGPLDLRGRVQGDSDRRVYWSGGRTVVGTDRGVVVYDDEGNVVGLDPLDGARRSRPPALGTTQDGSGVLAMVTTEGDRRDSGESVITLRLLEASTGRVIDQGEIDLPRELSTRATSVHTTRGSVLVGFGSSTLVIPTGE